MKKLPKVLYVRREVDGDSSYCVAYERLADVVNDGDVTVVGTYLLQAAPRKYRKVVSQA